MTRSRKLEPKAREMIKHKLYEMGEIETEEVMEMIRPHFLFNPVIAKEKELRTVAQKMLSGIRDDKRVRTVFACNIDGVSKYVNIDVSRDIASLRGVDRQLAKKLEGLEASSAKASRRRMEVEGQMSLDLEKLTDDGK